MPCADRDQSPYDTRAGKCDDRFIGRQRKERGGKPYHGNTAESRAGGIECRGFPATARASHARVFLTANFMAFDERGAGAKDGRQSQEEAADGRTPDGINNSCEDGVSIGLQI